ncbi:MAG TPA: 3-isopropylmalate dehydratase small subunit [Pirellulaceae bacterium]|jgi:3-isopropylmalate/(R)-2-methylmalate dehydratase small subunit|nr:3-isopropylmalate dehydratase small subunit [Pirellulaceae bacterium]
MQAFTKIDGVVGFMDRANVDTDQIIPKQFLKRIERSGFGQYLFFDWRFDDAGNDRPDFELNQPDAKGAQILVAQQNFGCGSSREHAVWALEDYGLRVVLAPSFADIFFSNCFKNGVLPIRLSEAQIDDLFARGKAVNGPYRLIVDLQSQTIVDGQGLSIPFEVDAFRRECLLNGWDDVALTLRHEEKITAFEQANA